MLIREHYIILLMKSRLVTKKSLYREKHDSIENAFFFCLNIPKARNKISSA